MPTSSKMAPEPSSVAQSVRVQVYSHELLGNKESQPLANFRLRSSSSSTFADLAASVIERYERSQPRNGPRSEIGAVLDEKDCSFDMEDPIDIIQPNEFIRFILAKPIDREKSVISSTTTQQARPSLEDQFVRPSAHSTTKTSTGNGSNVPGKTFPTPQGPSQLPLPSSSSSDPVEVDAHGTPILSKKPTNDELEITGAISIGDVPRSSQVPSSPTRPAVKSSAFARSKCVKKKKSVVEQMQEPSGTGRLSGSSTLDVDSSSRKPVSTEPVRPSTIARPAPPRRPVNNPTIETPQRQTKTAPSAARPVHVPKGGNEGLRDPYDFPSNDDEEYDLPLMRKPLRKIAPGSGISSAQRIKQEVKPALNSTPVRDAKSIHSNATPAKAAPAKAIAGTPVAQVNTPVAKKTPSSRLRTPQPLPKDAVIIELPDSSNTDASRRQSLEQIAEGAKTISISDSQSLSEETDEAIRDIAKDLPVPPEPSRKALGKRSHHSVNDHVNIVDQRRSKTPNEASDPILLRNSRGVFPIHRKSSSPPEVSSSLKASDLGGVSPRRTRQSTKHMEEAQKKQVAESVRLAEESETRRTRSETLSHASQDAAIKNVKSKMEVKFGKKGPKQSIPDAFFAERSNSDDEYRDYSSDEEDEPQDKNIISKAIGDEAGIKPNRRNSSVISSSNNGKGARPRSLSRSSSQSTVTPINTLKSEVQDIKPVQPTSRFHRGYPKRFRDRFSDASDSEYSEEDEESSDISIPTPQPAEPMGRQPRWKPMDWIMRFQTTFGSQSQEVADGPFKGYIPFGPKAGTYLPSYGPPSDQKLAEAEKTAVLKDACYDVTPDDSTSDSSDSSDVKDNVSELEDRNGGDAEGESIPNKNGSNEGVSTSNSEEGLADSRHLTSPDRGNGGIKPRPGRPTVIPSSQTPELSITSADEDEEEVPSPVRDRASERAGRIDRTTEYVFTGTRTQKHPPSNITVPSNGPESISPRLPSNLAPATTPAAIESPPSGVSETTSIQIAQQLTQDSQQTQHNAPPSNQELGILLSSSPERASNERKVASAVKAKKKKKTRRISTGTDHDDTLTTSSTEPSAGIPARLPPKTPPKERRSVPNTPQAIPESPLLEHPSPSANFILNGIAQRRSTRLKSMSSATRPNYNITGLQSIVPVPTTAAPEQPSSSRTPSKPLARKLSFTTSKDTKKKVLLPLSKDDEDETPTPSFSHHNHVATTTGISVELSPVQVEKQAEYEAVALSVSPERKPDPVVVDNPPPHPLKSFEAINNNGVFAGARVGVSTPEPRDVSDSSDGVLEYVLRESPRWLNGITEVADAPTPPDPSSKKKLLSATTKGKGKGRRYSESTPRAKRVSVVEDGDGDEDGKKKNDDALVLAESQWAKPVQRQITPVPLIPTFLTVTDETPSSQRASSSKKRKRASTVSEVMPLVLEPLVGKETKKHRSKEKAKPQSEEPPDLGDGNREEQKLMAEAPPTIAKDLDNENAEDDDILSSSKNKKKGNKRKRQELHQASQQQLPNGEVDVKPDNIYDLNYGTSMNDTKVAGDANDDDNGPPKKKARMKLRNRKTKKAQQPQQLTKPKIQHPLIQKESKKLNRKQRRQQRDLIADLDAADVYHPPASAPPALPSDQTKKKKKNKKKKSDGNNWWDKNQNQNQSTTSTSPNDGHGDGEHAVTSPTTRSRTRANSMLSSSQNADMEKGKEKRNETRARARTIITPPATSRPSSPESTRVL